MYPRKNLDFSRNSMNSIEDISNTNDSTIEDIQKQRNALKGYSTLTANPQDRVGSAPYSIIPATNNTINDNANFVNNSGNPRKLAFLDNGNSMTNNAWIKTNSGKTYVIDPNGRMKQFDSNGIENTNFQEQQKSSRELLRNAYNKSQQVSMPNNTSPYEITNSSWTPEQTKAFMKTPVHGGAYRVVSPTTVNRDRFLAKYGTQNNILKEPKMPKFTAPGFTGAARRARIHSQKMQWLQAQRDQQYGLAKIKANNEPIIQRNLAQIGLDRERLALDRQKFNTNNRKQKSTNKKPIQRKWKFVADKDPITGNPLKTGMFYDEATGEIKQYHGAENININSGNDSIKSFLDQVK